MKILIALVWFKPESTAPEADGHTFGHMSYQTTVKIGTSLNYVT